MELGSCSKAPAFNHETLQISSYDTIFDSVHQNYAQDYYLLVNIQITADKRLSEFEF